VSFIDQSVREPALDTRQANVEASVERVAFVRQVEVHLSIDDNASRQRKFLL
jgi:hypothetical protein